MDFGLAVLTFETAGMLIGMLLLRGLVGSPTFGAGEYYCGLRSAAHLRSISPTRGGAMFLPAPAANDPREPPCHSGVPMA
jgi:hypothetical protein